MQEIRSLSGLRLLAALAVVAGETWRVHRGLLREHFPNHVQPVAFVLHQEHVLAGLFFCLSGYVLTHCYLTRLTPGLSRRGAELKRFLTARAARIWPTYLVVLHVMLALLVARSVRSGGRPLSPDLDALTYIRQLLLVQVWAEPDHTGLSWLPLSWALSALVAASLAFPVLAVLVERMTRVTEPSTRLVFACLLPLPVTLVMTTRPSGSGGYLWVLLVLSFFLAGMLAATAVSGASRTGRWSWAMVALTGAVLATAAWMTLDTEVSARGVLALAVVPTVSAAAASTGPAAAVLGSGLLVACSRVSYSLMLVHVPVMMVHAAVLPPVIAHTRPWVVVASLVAAVAVSAVLAFVLWSLVELPLRRAFGSGYDRSQLSLAVPHQAGVGA